MKILIVERDISLLETMKDICDIENLIPITAKNCDEARNFLLKGQLPDLIICDEFVPLRSGSEWRQELSLHPKWKEIPFVLMKAQRDKMGNTQTMELQKPFSIDEVLGIFQKIRLSSRTRT